MVFETGLADDFGVMKEEVLDRDVMPFDVVMVEEGVEDAAVTEEDGASDGEEMMAIEGGLAEDVGDVVGVDGDAALVARDMGPVCGTDSFGLDALSLADADVLVV